MNWARAYQNYFSNFIRTGDPNGKSSEKCQKIVCPKLKTVGKQSTIVKMSEFFENRNFEISNFFKHFGIFISWEISNNFTPMLNIFTYSLSPKIDAFTKYSRNFQNFQTFFGKLCQNPQFLVKNNLVVTLKLYRYRLSNDLGLLNSYFC